MIFRYDDNSVFHGEWKDAPAYGVQFISFYDPVKQHPVLRHQGDFYREDKDGSIVAMDLQSLLRYVVDDLKVVKVGSMVSQHTWTEIYDKARADRDSLRD